VILVDSSIWIAYFNGSTTPLTDLLDRLLDDAERAVVLGDLVMFEVLRGFRHDPEFERARRWLVRLPCVEIGGERLALKAAVHYRTLRKQGLTIRSPIDTLIATFCIEEGCTLLHDDRDFEPFAAHLGLRVIAPV
jgi:predicted nucleic acid-binding protein